MKSITHEEQKEKWEKEHATPNILLQNASPKASSSVIKFLEWLKNNANTSDKLKGLEICCGKGRSVIWLATQGVTTIGLDFSSNAIVEAQHRAKKVGVEGKAKFIVQDATLPYPIESSSLDFIYDCFGSTDIESLEGREAALDNMIEVLKPGGYLMVYLLSSDNEFQVEMIKKHPGPDPGSFIHPVNGKYEKTFSEDEVRQFYRKLNLKLLQRIPKKDTYFGKEYKSKHIYAVFQKPKI